MMCANSGNMILLVACPQLYSGFYTTCTRHARRLTFACATQAGLDIWQSLRAEKTVEEVRGIMKVRVTS